MDYITSFSGGSAVLCSVEYIAASLAPTHFVPAPPTEVYPDIASCALEGKIIPRLTERSKFTVSVMSLAQSTSLPHIAI